MRDKRKKSRRKEELLEAKRQYLKLRYKIEMYELERNEPPVELVARARIVGRLAEIPEEELNCL
jgi:hypothetical protein